MYHASQSTIQYRCRYPNTLQDGGIGYGLDQAEPASESEISVQEVSTGIPVSADMDKKKWMDRYLSVSYPLRYIKVTSPYGYRKDPFTGKSKFLADWTCAHVATR